MEAEQLIEHELRRILDFATQAPCPPRLAAAYRYAILPGGSWIRPRLALAVAQALASPPAQLSLPAGARSSTAGTCLPPRCS